MSLALFLKKEINKPHAYQALKELNIHGKCIFTSTSEDKVVGRDIAVFDNTEILDFKGCIISDDIESSLYVTRFCSSYVLYHIYDPEDKRLFDLIKLSSQKNIYFSFLSEQDKEDFTRKVPGIFKGKCYKNIESLIKEGIEQYETK
jgi:hypothetical protein